MREIIKVPGRIYAGLIGGPRSACQQRSGGGKGGLIRFYHEIAGVGLVFPRADRPIAVEWVGYQVIMLRPIEGLEFVEETVTALGYSTDLAHPLFRECWSIGTGSDTDLCRAFGWEIEAHKFKVATAAGLATDFCVAWTSDLRPTWSSAAGCGWPCDPQEAIPRQRGDDTTLFARCGPQPKRTGSGCCAPLPNRSLHCDGPDKTRAILRFEECPMESCRRAKGIPRVPNQRARAVGEKRIEMLARRVAIFEVEMAAPALPDARASRL